jgi:hypothetical protein
VRSNKIVLTKAITKVLLTAFALLLGGVFAGMAVSVARTGSLWSRQSFAGFDLQTLWLALTFYWIVLTLFLRGYILGFKPERSILAAGTTAVLTLAGVVFLAITYVVGMRL